MNVRLARALISLYPSSWKARYRREFTDFLAERPASARVLLDVILTAAKERVRWQGEQDMAQPQQSLRMISYAWLAAIAAGVNLCGSVDDSPLEAAMRTNVPLLISWNMVAAGSALAVIATLVFAIPAVWTMLRSAQQTKRFDVAWRLALPPCAALILLLWVMGVVLKTGWAPTLWDITGAWTAPVGWPPVSVRWALGSVTLALIAMGTLGSALSLRQALERSELSRYRVASAPLRLVAGAMVLMTAGILSWGIIANHDAPAAFQGSGGGLLGSTTSVSWAISFFLFAASSALAICSARLLDRATAI